MSEKAPSAPPPEKEVNIREAIAHDHVDLYESDTGYVREAEGRVTDAAIAYEMAHAAKPLIDEVLGTLNSENKEQVLGGRVVRAQNPETGSWQQYKYSDLHKKVLEANQLADEVGGELLRDKRRAEIEARRAAQSAASETPTPTRTPETNSAPANEFLNQIATKAKRVILYSSIKAGIRARRGNVVENGMNQGLQSFGDVGSAHDGAGVENVVRFDAVNKSRVKTPEGDKPDNLVETAQFIPAVEPVYGMVTKERTKKRWLRKDLKYTVEEEGKIGTKSVTAINGEGKEEPAVDFIYTFNLADKPGGIDITNPLDNTYTDERGRPGNHLYIRCRLPASQANELRNEIAKNPLVARELAEKFALENIQLPEAVWRNGSSDGQRSVRPPYEDLPSDHTLKLVEPAGEANVWTAQPLPINRPTATPFANAA